MQSRDRTPTLERAHISLVWSTDAAVLAERAAIDVREELYEWSVRNNSSLPNDSDFHSVFVRDSHGCVTVPVEVHCSRSF